MATDTGGGTTTSFNNTPQAKDDFLTAAEDCIYSFDVMANDLGGNAKILWSIDDTTMTDDSGNGTYDLLAKDGTPTSMPEYSDLGARIWIENGVVKYDSNTIDYLAAGQQAVDKFTYAIRLANGTLSWATVYVTLTGTNDSVAISATTATGTVVEDSATTPSPADSNVASGTISFTDTDLADTHTASCAAAPTNTTTLGTFVLGSVNEAANAANGSVGWTYTINEAAAQCLAAGQNVTESYVITIDDGHGSTTTQTVTVTITGTNDVVIVTSATAAGTVVEDSATTASPADSNVASGTIAFSDVDLTDTHSASYVVNPSNTTALGTFALGSVSEAANAANGSVGWTYTINEAPAQYLAAGQSVTEKYVVTIDDGHGSTTTQTVTVTITGTNDFVSVTSATAAGTVVEDSATTASPADSNVASGTIAFSDVDLTDTHTASCAAAPTNTTTLGTFVLGSVNEAANAANGSVGWTYTINEAAAQYLAAGQSVTEQYVVTIDDGHGSTTTQTVTLTITGSNDDPVLSVDTAGGVTEDATDPTLTDSGTLSFTDVDVNDTHTMSASYNADAVWSGGSLDAGQVAALTAGFTADSDSWDYALANAAVDFLAEGETITLSFDVAVSDNHGGSDTETVTLTITGSNDDPVLSADTAGGVTEDATDPTLTDSGTLSFTDVDVNDTHTVSASYNADAVWSGGSLDAGQVAALSAGFTADGDSWDYALANAAVDFLAEGETITLSFDVAVSDNHGGSDTETVTLTITGSNDDPVLSADTAGGVTEDATDPTLTDSGTLSFTDVDVNDTHTVSASYNADAVWSGGSLDAGQVAALSAGFTADGDSWDYALANAAVDFLAEGETITLSFDVAVSDNHGGSDTETVTLTITGSNDDPVLSADTAGGVTEDATDPTLTDSGTLSFTDVDVNDTHTVSASYNADAVWSGGSLDAGQVAALSAGFTADGDSWDYALANAAVDFLAEGETITLSFDVAVSDNHGGSDTETVTLTITGSNDDPVLSADTAGGVTEDATDPTLTDSGTLSFTDVDVNDTHTVSASYNADAVWSGGSLDAGQVAALSAGFTADGDSWDYALANAAVDFLAEGETITLSFDVAVSDNHGGSDTETVTLTITGSNDDPVLSADTAGGVTEDATDPTLTDSGTLSFTDVDVNDTHTVSASYNADAVWSGGSLDAGQVAALSAGFTADGDSWDYALANAAVDFLAEGETITLSFDVAVSDNHGGSDTETVTLTITGSNDAPIVASAIADQSSDEDAAWSFTVPVGTFTDIDHGTALIYSATLDNGDPLPSWLTFDPDTQTFSGIPPADFNGILDIKVTASDTVENVSDTFQLTINSVNDAPVNSAPASYTTDEDTPVKLSGLSIADVDSGSGTISVTLSVGSGIITAASGGGVTVSGSGTGSLVLSGTVVDINAYLAAAASQPTYVPAANSVAGATLTMTTSDLGNTGVGGALGDTDLSTIFINAVNDAPVNTLPASYSTSEDTPFKLSGLSVSDVDSGAEPISVTLSVSGGTLTAASGAGVTVTGSGTGTIVLTGSAASINAFLATSASQPTYVPAANASGSVALTMTSDDAGATGAGGPLTDTDTSTITVTPLNDAPENAVPGAQTATAASAKAIGGVSVNDVDNTNLTTTISVAHGTLSVTSVAGLTITGNGTGSVQLSGDKALINSALAGLSYTATAGYSGSDSLSVSTTDGALSDVDNVAITVDPGRTVPTDIKLTMTSPLGDQNNMQFQIAGTLTATDPDSGAFTFTFSGGGTSLTTNGSTFTIVGNTLQSTNNLAQNSTYSLDIVATQAGDGPGQSKMETFTIITGSNGANTADNLSGQTGDDVMYSGGGADMLLGLGGDDTLFGHAGNDALLSGGAGNDTIYGGNGNDILNGGAGSDIFVFNVAPNGTTNHDTIQDFDASGIDRIALDDAIFSAIGATLDASEFRASAGGNAADANDLLLYDSATGNLFYDADGNGAGAKVLVATITPAGLVGTVDTTDFIIV